MRLLFKTAFREDADVKMPIAEPNSKRTFQKIPYKDSFDDKDEESMIIVNIKPKDTKPTPKANLSEDDNVALPLPPTNATISHRPSYKVYNANKHPPKPLQVPSTNVAITLLASYPL